MSTIDRKGYEVFSRRFRFFVAMFLIGAVAVSYAGNAIAQDSTPAAGPIVPHDLAPGIYAEVLAGAPSILAPGQTVYVARFVFQPGSEIFEHSHPGTTVLGVLSG